MKNRQPEKESLLNVDHDYDGVDDEHDEHRADRVTDTSLTPRFAPDPLTTWIVPFSPQRGRR